MSTKSKGKVFDVNDNGQRGKDPVLAILESESRTYAVRILPRVCIGNPPEIAEPHRFPEEALKPLRSRVVAVASVNIDGDRKRHYLLLENGRYFRISAEPQVELASTIEEHLDTIRSKREY